jgi:predicted metal-binding membrane protein
MIDASVARPRRDDEPMPKEDQHARWLGAPARLLERRNRALLLVLGVLTLGTWALTIYHVRTAHTRLGTAHAATGDTAMATATMHDAMDLAAMGMVGAGWSLAAFATFVVAWTVMMAAMMFPAAAPLLLLYRAVAVHRRSRGDDFAPTWVFATGYLLIWTTAGAGTWLLVHWVGDLAEYLGAPASVTWAPLALGDVLIVAGLYQFTALKQACLDNCRSPFVFITRHWREGYDGALRIGMVHGLYCLGCCWALFAVLVAAGAMSLAWMLLLTLVVFAEKVLPGARRTSQLVGLGLILLGLGVLGGVVHLP